VCVCVQEYEYIYRFISNVSSRSLFQTPNILFEFNGRENIYI
jgi:hypothetical protein